MRWIALLAAALSGGCCTYHHVRVEAHYSGLLHSAGLAVQFDADTTTPVSSDP